MALEAGQMGARGVGGFGERVLDTADRFDRVCYGRRALVLWGLALLAVLGAAVDATMSPQAPLFMALTTTAFTMAALLLGIARALSLREDDGTWSLRLVSGRLKDVVALAADAVSTKERTRALGKMAVFLGALTLVARNITILARIVASDIFSVGLPSLEGVDEVLLSAGVGLGAVGGMLWLVGTRRLKREALRLHLRPEGREVEALLRAAKTLPSVIDCRDDGNVAVVRACGNPLLTQLVDALASWKPRGAHREVDYQLSLYRHLHRTIPEAEPEREQPIAGTRARPDFVVAGAVLIEMKVDVNTPGQTGVLGKFYATSSIGTAGL